jgi:hypothetical protein
MHTLTGVADAAWALKVDAPEEDDDVPGRATCRVGGVTYEARGLLGRGARADVFLAARVRRPTELVVIKALREPCASAKDGALLEFARLCRAASGDAAGAAFFTTLVPQPVTAGVLERPGGEARHALVYRWRSGFQHTLEDVRRAYPGGVDGRTVVWMWRRILELLAWLHASGVAHGAVVPEHVLVHPRHHGAVLVGWSRAVVDDRVQRSRDVAMSARAALHVTVPESLPASLRDLLLRTAEGAREEADAGALSGAVLAAATDAYGPPSFHPFVMPGWE